MQPALVSSRPQTAPCRNSRMIPPLFVRCFGESRVLQPIPCSSRCTASGLRRRARMRRACRSIRIPEERELAEGSIAADELRLLIERIERLEEEKKAIADDVRDVYGEAKARGYDPKTMRTVVRLRKMENHARQEAEALLDTYKAALGLA